MEEDGTFTRWPMLAITVLRVLVGWHFLYEGLAKLTSPGWSAAGYMRASRGPFAALFKWMASQPHLLDYANLITMYGLTLVGVLLILGLFTRLASLGGLAFVLLFYLCNPPFVGYFYSIPTGGQLPGRQQEPRGGGRAGCNPRNRQRPFRRARPHPARAPFAAAEARRGLSRTVSSDATGRTVRR